MFHLVSVYDGRMVKDYFDDEQFAKAAFEAGTLKVDKELNKGIVDEKELKQLENLIYPFLNRKIRYTISKYAKKNYISFKFCFVCSSVCLRRKYSNSVY